MWKIQTNQELIQTQNFSILGKDVELTLKWNEVGSVWQFDLKDTNTDEIYVLNRGLAINAPSLIDKRLPFVLMLIDESGQGLTCVDNSQMGDTVNLYLLSKTEFKEAMLKLYRSAI